MKVIRAAALLAAILAIASCGLLEDNATIDDADNAFARRGINLTGGDLPQQLFQVAPVQDYRFLDVIGLTGAQRAPREELYVVVAGSGDDAQKIGDAWLKIGQQPRIGGISTETDYVAPTWEARYVRAKNVVLLYQLADGVAGQTRWPEAKAAMHDLSNG